MCGIHSTICSKKKENIMEEQKMVNSNKICCIWLENLVLYLVPASLGFGLLSHKIAADCSHTEIRSLL